MRRRPEPTAFRGMAYAAIPAIALWLAILRALGII